MNRPEIEDGEARASDAGKPRIARHGVAGQGRAGQGMDGKRVRQDCRRTGRHLTQRKEKRTLLLLLLLLVHYWIVAPDACTADYLPILPQAVLRGHSIYCSGIL